jgi:hypothetical protein
MTTSKLSKILGGLGAAAVLAAAGQASAMETFSPFQPGVTSGAPSALLPPPGIYGAVDNAFLQGPVANNAGNNIGVNVWLDTFIPSVLWVPQWQPLAGATFGVAVVQPYVFRGTSLGSSGTGTIGNGLFNTIISPVNLSWNLQNGFFVKAGLAIYIPDGYIQHISVPGGKVEGGGGNANDFWTFEPDFAVSFVSNGLQITGHAVFDFNTFDNDTQYQSGGTFYFDYGATQTLGKWSFGVGGNFTQQFQADTGSGVLLAKGITSGSEIQHVLLGPVVSYEAGPVNITARYLVGIHAENDANFSAFHLSFALPF